MLMIMAATLWGVLGWALKLGKFLTITAFITNRRLGSCFTIFSRFNIRYTFAELPESILAVDYFGISEGVGSIILGIDRKKHSFTAFQPRELLVAIWQINDDIVFRYFITLEYAPGFLECLAAVVKENGGAMHVPELKVFKSGLISGRHNLIYEHPFLNGTVETISYWYERVCRALAEKDMASLSPQVKKLKAMAGFISHNQFGEMEGDFTDLQGRLKDDERIITAVRCGGIHEINIFKTDLVCFTNRGIILTDRKKRKIKAHYPYNQLSFQRGQWYIKINSGWKFYVLIYVYNQVFFPLTDTLILLGCNQPKEQSDSGIVLQMPLCKNSNTNNVS